MQGGMNVGGPRGPIGPEFEPAPEEAQAAPDAQFPRSGWKDAEALGRAAREARGEFERSISRPNHRTKWIEARRGVSKSAPAGGPASIQVAKYGRPGGAGLARAGQANEPDRPIIAPKYGLRPRPDVDPVQGGSTTPEPVIVAKYGLRPRPDVDPTQGGSTTPPAPEPVIVAKYGLRPRPDADQISSPPEPIIVAKYGLRPRPDVDTTPPEPVIVAKYGLRPRS